MRAHHRLFGILFTCGVLSLSLGASGCGDSPTGASTGTLAVHMQLDGSLNAPADLLAPATDDLVPGKRTPLADLVVTFDAIWVRGHCYPDSGDDVMDSTDVIIDDDGDDDDSTGVAAITFVADEDDDDGEEGDENDDGDGCRIEIMTGSEITVSVAGLDTTLSTLLGSAEVPAGSYRHVWIHVSDAWVITADDSAMVTAIIPGRDDNPLKVNTTAVVEGGEVTDVMIVFDVYRSVVESPPGSRNFKIKPVLHEHQGWAR